MQDASRLLIKARANAIEKPGYITSETLSGCDNPNEVLVVSTWRNKADWDAYTKDPERIRLEEEIKSLLEGPTEYLAYTLGLQ